MIDVLLALAGGAVPAIAPQDTGIDLAPDLAYDGMGMVVTIFWKLSRQPSKTAHSVVNVSPFFADSDYKIPLVAGKASAHASLHKLSSSSGWQQ